MYVEHIPDVLLDDIIGGRCVPIIGAGFSLNANMPDGMRMPTWDVLGKEIARAFKDYQYSGALEAISAYADEYSRLKLIEKLYSLLLVDKAQPGSVHRGFAQLPFDMIVTTNFEFLLEAAYGQAGRPCRPIVDEDHLPIAAQGPEVRILKLHGDLHHPKRMVITEEDYDRFLDTYPLLATYLANLLITRTALFIGYSLDDPDFRQIWQVLRDRLGSLRRQPYSILVNASQQLVRRYERRGVKVINFVNHEGGYSDVLTGLFRELRQHWTQKVITASTSTEDDALGELSLPTDSPTRLCFFSVPGDLVAYYKAHVFPIATARGFAPVTAYDVLTPGDSITAKLAALIDRAALILVDLSTPATELELHMALARKGKENWILLIAEKGMKMPFDLRGIGHVIRPSGLKGDQSIFLKSIDDWFARVADQIGLEIHDEASRLLAKKEYRAAVIAAISRFEVVLRTIINKRHAHLVAKLPERWLARTGAGQLVEFAVQSDIISKDAAKQAAKWMMIRNNAVHLSTPVSAAEAREVVEGVQKVARTLG